MNERLLFPDLNLFKKQVIERFITVTKEIYRNHPVYSFIEDDLESKILIYPSYANVEAPSKQPIITIKMGSYDFVLTDTFNFNMSADFRGDDNVFRGYESSKLMSTSVMVLIRAYAEEEASDLADEFASLLVFACRNMYAGVGLMIRGARVSETDEADRTQGTFQTSVVIPIEAMWGGMIVDNLSDPVDPEVPIEIPSSPIDGYDAPGIRVWKESLNK
jgi:hypothetical protein